MKPEEPNSGPDPDQAWSPLAAYLAGEGTSQERTAFELWVQASPVRSQVLARAREQWNRGVEPPQPDVALAWETVHAAITPPAHELSRSRLNQQRGRDRMRQPLGGHVRVWPSVVTLSLIAVAIGFGWFRNASSPGMTRVYRTAAGQQATIPLPDGTSAILSPNTTLRLSNFGTTLRTVSVDDGEAYFVVSNTTAQVPFIVRSGSMAARVLGTAFYVRNHARAKDVHIAVASGKISVSGPAIRGDVVTLTAGQIGDVVDSTLRVNAVGDGIEEPEWRDGELVFRRAPVPSVLKALSRWYGYTFRMTDSTLAQQKVTMWVSTQSSASALATLEQILNVNFNVVGDTVTLTPHAPSSVPRRLRSRMYNVWTPNAEVGR